MKTLIRKPADPATAGVLRGERSPFEGTVIHSQGFPDSSVGRAPAEVGGRGFDSRSGLPCDLCGGRGTWIGGDTEHLCWCVRDEAQS